MKLRLYLAGHSPNSAQATVNLRTICRECLQGPFELEVVDVLEDPLRALADGILVTPTLTKLFPAPAAKIFGNLGDRAAVLSALGIL